MSDGITAELQGAAAPPDTNTLFVRYEDGTEIKVSAPGDKRLRAIAKAVEKTIQRKTGKAEIINLVAASGRALDSELTARRGADGIPRRASRNARSISSKLSEE